MTSENPAPTFIRGEVILMHELLHRLERIIYRGIIPAFWGANARVLNYDGQHLTVEIDTGNCDRIHHEGTLRRGSGQAPGTKGDVGAQHTAPSELPPSPSGRGEGEGESDER